MTTLEFIADIEGYYDSKYKRPQLVALRDWCSKKQGRVLQSVYDVLIQNFEASKYQALPLIKNLKGVIEEAVEILPPLPPSDALQITDGMRNYRNQISEMFRQLIEKKKMPALDKPAWPKPEETDAE